MTWWQQLLANVGGTTAAIAVVGFLARSIIKHWLDRDLAHHKALLEAESVRQLEQLRHALQMERQTRDAQVRGVYSRQLEATQAIYVQWKQSRSWLTTLVHPGGQAAKHRELLNELNRNLNKLWQVVTENRILLPKSLMSQVDSAYDNLEKLAFDAELAMGEMEEEGKTAFQSKDFMRVRRQNRPKLDPVEQLLEFHSRVLLGVDAGEMPVGVDVNPSKTE
jgi:U3 small nucleolar RNA-associated protein 14